MDKDYRFQKITDGNAKEFVAYLPQKDPSLLFGGNTMGIGVYKDKTPCAAVYLIRRKGCMQILHLSVDPDFRHGGIGTRLVKSVIKSAIEGGFQEVQITYSSRLSGDLETFLKKNGFDDVSETGVIYRIPRIFLGDFLKGDIDALEMKEAWNRISRRETVKSFGELPQRGQKFFSFLRPDPELSLAVPGKKEGEKYKAFITVSMFDGEYFISDLWFQKGCEEEASGLIYACLGNIYMTLTDSESFSVVARREVGRKIMEYIFDPLIPFGIYREGLKLASFRIRK